MKHRRPLFTALVGGAALWLGVAVAACSSSATSATSGGADGGADATTGQGGSKSCTTDSQCTPPPTTPANCATGKCNSVTGTCTFKAKDADGDGHAAANCKATNGVVVQDGDDCDDTDKNLYPGHPEACTTLDGHTVTDPCQAGTISCLPGGTASACTGTVVCTNQACVGHKCAGTCAPGQTQCSGNTGVQTCQSDGTWSASVECAGQACLPKGPGSAACGGSCAPNQTQCDGSNGLQTCTLDGAWGVAAPCVNSTCQAGDAGTGASCQGSCSAGQTTCSGNSVETCVNGLLANPTPCDAQNETCVQTAPGTASCSGTCIAYNYQCVGQQPQQCDATGTWQNKGSACVNSACVASSSLCQGGCTPASSQPCGNCGLGTATCNSAGQPGSCSTPATACVPNDIGVCQTCSSIAAISAGSKTCSASCAYGACQTTAGNSWTGSGTDFSHQSGGPIRPVGQPAYGWEIVIYPTDPTWYLQYGPYATLAKGSYSVTFSLATTGTCNGPPILPGSNRRCGVVDVTHDGGTTDDAHQVFGATGGSFTTITLPFTVATDCTPNYEFRIHTEVNTAAGTTIVVMTDSTTLKYLGP